MQQEGEFFKAWIHSWLRFPYASQEYPCKNEVVDILAIFCPNTKWTEAKNKTRR
jgi:hypothetical protein